MHYGIKKKYIWYKKVWPSNFDVSIGLPNLRPPHGILQYRALQLDSSNPVVKGWKTNGATKYKKYEEIAFEKIGLNKNPAIFALFKNIIYIYIVIQRLVGRLS